jgi:hypothetical protein
VGRLATCRFKLSLGGTASIGQQLSRLLPGSFYFSRPQGMQFLLQMGADGLHIPLGLCRSSQFVRSLLGLRYEFRTALVQRLADGLEEEPAQGGGKQQKIRQLEQKGG